MCVSISRNSGNPRTPVIRMSGRFWNNFRAIFKKKESTEVKESTPIGQEQYKVTKQHNYDEVDLTQASNEQKWEVDKKPRNYDEIEIGANEPDPSKEKAS